MSKKSLFDKLSKKKFVPVHAAEVGVYHPKTSNIYDYIIHGVKCTLVEPDPESIQLIKNHFADLNNLTLHECAIYDYNGEINLVQRKASSFISELQTTPAIINDKYKLKDNDKITVVCKTFDNIDDGSIDLLSVDIEGSEWYVIKYMKSRPAAISIETHGAMYVNPFINKIMYWMKMNNYIIWYKTNSDTIFVKKNTFKINIPDRFTLSIKDFFLLMRKLRKILKNNLINNK